LLNGEIWRKLEKQVRQWVHKNKEVYVVSALVLTPALITLGAIRYACPILTTKLSLVTNAQNANALPFYNKKDNQDLAQYAVANDQVEERTGINFFHHLPDRVENRLQSQAIVHQWDFDARVYIPSSNDHQKSAAKRCNGQTNSGKRCKGTITSENQYCWQHNHQTSGQHKD